MSKAEDNVDDFIGDKNDGEAVRWFGMYSLITTIVSAYMIDTNMDQTWIAAGSNWWSTQIWAFWPVFMGWLFVSFFDSEFMRSVYRMLVTISVLGPFAINWYNLVVMVYSCDGSCLDELSLYIWTAIYSAINIFQMIVDIILLPQIYNWTDDADILDNGAKNLLAVMF